MPSGDHLAWTKARSTRPFCESDASLAKRRRPAADYVRLFNYLEAAGLRLFAKEASLSQKGRVDLAFVQARWSPEGKLYLSLIHI